MKDEEKIRAELRRVRKYLESALYDELPMSDTYRFEGKKELLEWILE